MKRTFGKRSASVNQASSSAVLFDGWSLAFFPGSPAAVHLLELLEALPAGIVPWVALPVSAGLENAALFFDDLRVLAGDTGEALTGGLSSAQNIQGVHPIHSPAPDTPAGRLRWEQMDLPRLVRRIRARQMHLFDLSAPLLSPVPISISPAEDMLAPNGDGRLASRMRLALGKGGGSQALAILWPGDLPYPNLPAVTRRTGPYAHSAFRALQPRPDGLPEDYVLAPGALDHDRLHLLAETWSWAASGLGEDWSLCVCDLDRAGLEDLRDQCSQAGTAASLVAVSARSPKERAALLQHSSVVLSLGPVHAWGDTLLQSLAAGRPLVAEETPPVSARVGPAAYLAAPGDARGLAAALITVLIEPDVSQQLCQAARERAQGWDEQGFIAVLGELF